MSAVATEIINKYQGVAPKQVICAVRKAASRTGADFSFLMEKAAAESSFNPTAKSHTSSATGLFQFIESTWLNMVKQHGAKYGLGALADKIEIRNGRPCVDDCAVKKQILNLRRNPEISALMAGEFSAANKEYLESHTRGDVGATELYLAHFMGASGAAKFLNCRDTNPDAKAACLFPQAARANKNVFYDKETGKARTLEEIHTFFAEKFGQKPETTSGGTIPPSSDEAAAKPESPPLMVAEQRPAAAPAPSSSPSSHTTGRALPLFDDANESDDIIWNDDPRFNRVPPPAHRIAPFSILALAEMKDTSVASGFSHRNDRFGYNS